MSFTSSKTEFAIEVSDSGYFLKADRDFPLDSSVASSLAEAVSVIECDRMVSQDRADFAEYGLNEPQCVIEATYKDGTTLRLDVGSYNRHTGSYYVTVDGSDKVYLLDAGIVDAFQVSMNELLKDESVTPPEDGVEAVTEIEIVFSDGTKRKYSFTEGKEAETGEDGEETEGTEDRWILTITRPDGTEETRMEDFSEAAEGIYAELFRAELVEWVDYNVTEERRGEYGLEKPYAEVTVTYTETVTVSGEGTSSDVTKETVKTLHFYFGDAVQETPEVPADCETDGGKETSAETSTETAAEASTETAEEAEEKPGEEEGLDRYFLLDGGKVVYVVSESDFPYTLTGEKGGE